MAGSTWLDTGTPTNPRLPSIAFDAAGTAWVLYTSETAVGGVYPVRLGACASHCELSASWTWTTLADAGLGASGEKASLTFGSDGHLHATWSEEADLAATTSLRYATCASDCAVAGSWQVVTVASMSNHDGSPRPFQGRSIVADAAGHVRLAWRAAFGTYGTSGTYLGLCDANCTNPSSWSNVKLSPDHGDSGMLAVRGNGLVLVQAQGGFLSYAECASACGDAANWTFFKPFWATSYVALAVTPTGGVRVAFDQGGLGPAANQNTLNVVKCDANCTTADGWSGVYIMQPLDGSDGLDLGVDSRGGAAVAYENANGGFSMASCDGTTGDCFGNGTLWSTTLVESDATLLSPRPPLLACGASSTPKSFWFPGRMVQAAVSPAGHVGVVHVTYALESCSPGGTQEGVKSLRYFQF